MSETVYTHLAGDPHITVTAAEKWSRGMVQRLAEKYPDQVKIMCTNDDGSCVAHVPFEWMRIVPKRTLSLTEEQRQEVAERLRKGKKSTRE